MLDGVGLGVGVWASQCRLGLPFIGALHLHLEYVSVPLSATPNQFRGVHGGEVASPIRPGGSHEGRTALLGLCNFRRDLLSFSSLAVTQNLS